MDQKGDLSRKQRAALWAFRTVATCVREDRIPCKIEAGLFLGSMGASHNKDGLKSRNITHILTVANGMAPVFPDDFVYNVVAVADKEDTDLSLFFDDCIDFIVRAKRQGGAVLVHCFGGKSRSVAVVVAYLMKKRVMSLCQALEHVKSRRSQAAPYYGFILQLQEFEKSLQGSPNDFI